MNVRWLDVASALVVAAMFLGACTSRDTYVPTSALREQPSTVVVPSTTTTSTDAFGDAPRAVPGAPLAFEVETSFAALGERGELLRAYPNGTKVAVSIRRRGEPPGLEVAAHFGTAEVAPLDDGRVRFRVHGIVPATLWQREQRGRVAAELPTRPGEYEVGLNGLFEQPVVILAADSVAPSATTTAPDRGEPARRVLGEGDLAGVAFGRPEGEAIDALRARFGVPSFDDVENTECGPQRSVGWGSLVTTYRVDRRVGAAPERVFVGYTYHAPRAVMDEGPQGLRTAGGVAAGMSIAEVRALEPSIVFTTEQVGYALTTWYASEGSRLAGRLSDDVSSPHASVSEIASSLATPDRATYPECALMPGRR